jgi:hypothetical protein
MTRHDIITLVMVLHIQAGLAWKALLVASEWCPGI